MKTIVRNIPGFFIFILLVFLSLPALSIALDEVSADEEYIIELVNEIRRDPLTYAKTLGFDRQTLRDELPWLDAAAQTGFLPLTKEDSLFSRAHDNNLIDDDNGSAVDSHAQVAPEDDYMIMGETGGVISFFNFMAPKDAIKIVVDNLFKNELDPGRTEPRYICSVEYDIAGASFRSGLLDDSAQRAYFITLTLASSSLIKSQIQMLHVINQIRKEPITLQKYLAVNTLSDSMLMNFFTGFSGLKESYSPLFYQQILSDSANLYLNTPTGDSGEEQTPFERAEIFGYEGSDVKETFMRSRYDRREDVVPVLEIIEDILLNALEFIPLSSNILFSEAMDEAGIGLRFIYREKTIVADSAIDVGQANSLDDQPAIYGIVYSDYDKNGVYTPGEEIQGHQVSIYHGSDGSLLQNVFTDYAGYFSVSLPMDTYKIEITKESGYVKQINHQMFENSFLAIDISSFEQ